MGGWTKTKLMLNSTQVEVVVKVGVELGKKGPVRVQKTLLSSYKPILEKSNLPIFSGMRRPNQGSKSYHFASGWSLGRRWGGHKHYH